MPAPTTKIAPEHLIQAAKAPLLAYNDKNWQAARACMTSNSVYDEVATHRKTKGIDETLALWKGWAAAFPDSKATFHDAYVSGDKVVIELTWKGTHTGPLQLPKGPIAATGKKMEMRACCVLELEGEKVQLERQYFDMATMLQQLGITG